MLLFGSLAAVLADAAPWVLRKALYVISQGAIADIQCFLQDIRNHAFSGAGTVGVWRHLGRASHCSRGHPQGAGLYCAQAGQ